MSFKLVVLALCLAVVQVHAASCTVRTSGASLCTTVTLSPTDVIANSGVGVTQFDSSLGTLKGVYLTSATANYAPTGTYSITSSVNSFDILSSLTLMTVSFPADTNKGCSFFASTITGDYNVGGAVTTDGLLCQGYSAVDTRWESTTLNAGTVETFTINSAANNPPNYATTINTFTSTSSTPKQLTLSSAYTGSGTWTWVWSSTKTFSAAVLTGGGPAVSATITQLLNVGASFQYDYSPPASTTGDPQFVGFQGQHFQIHGTPDEHFSLISSANYYVNARFVYMATGSCTYNDTECFSHPGTYIGSLGFVTGDNRVKIVSGPHAQGLTVRVNDKLAAPGTKIRFDNDSYVHVISHNRVSVSAEELKLSIVNSDMFVNLGAEFTNGALLHAGHQLVTVPGTVTPAQADKMISTSYPEHLLHGLLGQTWRNIHWPHNRLYQGEPTDYQVADLFSAEFLYNQYQA